MRNNKLFVLVEGNDDERFFESILKPFSIHNSCQIQIWQYSQKKKSQVNRYLKSLKRLQANGLASYLLVADLDRHPCATEKKGILSHEFKHVTKDRMLIVCAMIEAWYLAGLNEEKSNQLGIPRYFATTDHITKQIFDSIIPSGFESRIDFMKEILKSYESETARSKNDSFGYFMRKLETDPNWV